MVQENARIHVLADEVARQIAAGEVVERPSAVVKELVENALDAGSTLITVEIQDGGKKGIRVSDNGCGIAREDVPLAFQRHATSKIATLEDLYHISHMGFRGEALYSIAAVSRVELTTKRRGDEAGLRVTNEGGQLGEITDAGCPDGTTLWVRDLFYNTPARLKFLRSAQSEAGAVGSVMSRLILANPSVSFRFISHGKTVYHSQGDGSLRNAVYSVLGKEIASHMVTVQGEEGGIRVEGCVGEPVVSRGNRTYEMLYVNGRPVNHPMVSKAVENAYGTTLMSQKFPVFVLNLSMPYEWVDVNVHPNKLQVRFAQDQQVFYAVQSCVRRALSGVEQKPTVMQFKAAVIPCEPEQRDKPAQDAPERQKTPVSPAQPQGAAALAQKPQSSPPQPREKPLPPPASMQQAVREYRSQVIGENQEAFAYTRLLQKAEPKPTLASEQALPWKEPQQEQTQVESLRLPEGTLRGVVFHTYAIIEAGDELYFVDQHAAHERLLYDQYMQALETGESFSQQLLVPQMLEVTYYQKTAIEENMELFAQLGFELEPFGRNSYQIRAVPHFLGQAQQSGFFLEVLDMLHSQTGNTRDERQRAIMQMSCKGAVKGGEPLSQQEMDRLLEVLRREDTPLSCPHGRPICMKLTRRELEKQFKRIV